MHDCDLMIAVGSRFDDRITGRLDAFSPGSKKIHIDIDPSSINKNVKVDLPIIGDCAHVLEDMVRLWRSEAKQVDQTALGEWWEQINEWRARNSLGFHNSKAVIKPQHAVQRLYELTKNRDTYITTEVGQHQMWAAQHYHFEEPNRWMTSGGLGTMGYGLPAAIGVQMAHPESLVIDIAGEASILMNIQEMSTAKQYRLPVKIFILNNEYMGMVRQWQELNHGNRLSHSWNAALPDFVALARAFGWGARRIDRPDELEDGLAECMAHNGPFFLDVRIAAQENCFPMMPAGRGHHEIMLAADRWYGETET
jgi:acetolactate synthase-1/2/3 large subunit